jgi:shikimate kinase
MKDLKSRTLRVAVVGACSSGKSTLVSALLDIGFDARHVAQEHSFVPAMWKKISKPDVLIYLEVDFDNLIARWPKANFKPHDLLEQNRRLAHARAHCDLYLNTNQLNHEEVNKRALAYLEGFKKRRSSL